MKRNRKTAIEIIDDVVNFYSADPVGRRAVITKDGGVQGCVYMTPDNRRCAVGRYLKKTVDARNLVCSVHGLSWAGTLQDVDLEKVLKTAYKGHSLEFWEKLQELHDNNGNWTDIGLSSYGRDRVDKLRKCYGQSTT